MESGLIANRYRIVELLSEGGMGKIFTAEDTLLDNQLIVLKTIKDNTNKKELEKALLAEFYTLFTLSHPNLLKVFDIARDLSSEELYLVTELAEGYTIDNWISDKNFDGFLEIIYQLLSGLSYLHRNNLIHGDLKPAHFIINENDGRYVKIIDFGLVKHTKDCKKDKIAGSIRYLSPEIFQGKGYSKGSDVYALGVSLFTSVYKRYPHDATTVRKYIEKASIETPVFRDPLFPIPESFIHILKKAMHPNPRMRYSDADEILSDICDAYKKIYSPGIANPSIFSPFVGRESEIAFLNEIIQNLLKRNIKVPFVNIFGEEGSGKKRLIRHLKVLAKDKGIEYFNSKFLPHMEKHLSVLRDIMPYLFIYCENMGIDISSFRGILDAFVKLNAGSMETLPNQAQKSNDIIFAAIDLIIRLLQKGVPIILIFEDYDKMDNLSRSFIEMLMYAVERHLLQSSILIILVNETKLQVLSNYNKVEYIEVFSFDKATTREFISKILGNIPVYDSLIESIYKTTNGNPMKIEKLLQSLFLNKIIFYKNGVYAISGDAEKFTNTLKVGFERNYADIFNTFSEEQRIITGFFIYSYKPLTHNDISKLLINNAFRTTIDFVFFLQHLKILQDSVEQGIRTIIVMDRNFYETALRIFREEEIAKIHSFLYNYFKVEYSSDFSLVCYHLYYSGEDNRLLGRLIRKAIDQVTKESVHSYKLIFFINTAIELQDTINDNTYIISLIKKKINSLYFLNEKDEVERMKQEYLTEETAKQNPLLYASILKSLLDSYSIDYNDQKIEELLPYRERISPGSDDVDIIRVLQSIEWNRVYLYLNRNKPHEALRLCDKIYQAIRDSDDYHMLSNYYGMIGELYSSLGDYQESLHYRELALNYAYKTEITNQIAISEHNMAVGYLNVLNIEETIRYLILAYEKFDKLRNYKLMGFALNNLSDVLLEFRQDSQAALSYALNAFESNKIVGGINLINSYKILGIIYKKLHKYKTSLEYLHMGKDLAFNNKRMTSFVEISLVHIDLLIELSAYRDSEVIISEAKAISEKSLNNYMLKQLLCREGTICCYTNADEISRLENVVKQMKKYESIEEAFLFLFYYFKAGNRKEFQKTYAFIRDDYVKTNLPYNRYIFYKSSIYYYALYGDISKMNRQIGSFFEFLQHEYNANWRDFYILFYYSRHYNSEFSDDIRKRALESYDFAKQTVPPGFIEGFIAEQEHLRKMYLGD